MNKYKIRIPILMLSILFTTFSSVSSLNFPYQYVTSKKGLMLRKSPTIKGEVLLKIPYNSPVELSNGKGIKETIDGIESYWFKIKYHTYEGWVFGGFLSDKYDPQFLSGKKNIVDLLYKTSVEGHFYKNKKIKLKMTCEEVEKNLGNPQSKDNGEWGAVYSYPGLYIHFSDYLHELNKESFIAQLQIPIDAYNIYYDDLIIILGKPDLMLFNQEIQGWEISYKTENNAMVFYTQKLDDKFFSVCILKPRPDLFKK